MSRCHPRLIWVATWLAVTVICPSARSHQFDPEPTPSPGVQWRDDTPIVITITWPSNDSYIAINCSMGFGASAHDGDEFLYEGEWHEWHDDVNSGTTQEDHHIWWQAPEGSFENPFGQGVVYNAPDFDPNATSGVRDVIIKCRAKDEGRPNCYNDPDALKERTVKIWQVNISKKQSESISGNNDMPGYSADPPFIRMPVGRGGEKLGWVEWGIPPGCTSYRGKTELKGAILPEVDATDGFLWYSEVTRGCKHQDSQSWHSEPEEDYYAWRDDSPQYEFQDGNSRHPDWGPGTDVNEVFMYDGPGFVGGANNDNNIWSAGWTDVVWETQFRSWVEKQVKVGVWRRLSGVFEWEVYFTLTVENGKWKVVGTHVP